VILNVHEDKCVNKHWWILEMDYKKQTAVLSVMFILVGMMFLVSVITEKALASINATAFTRLCCFSHVRAHLYAGSFLLGPGAPGIPGTPIKNELTWITLGSGLYGDEKGYVAADVGPSHIPVSFHFSNPARGSNTCSGERAGPVIVTCTITQGVHANARFTVIPLVALPDVNAGDANSGNEDDNSGDTP
jgi:hypothetical protein